MANLIIGGAALGGLPNLCERADMYPFQNEVEEVEIGDLRIENRLDRVIICGRIDVTRDKIGAEHARQLHRIFSEIVYVLRFDPNLPDKIPAPKEPIIKPNPLENGKR